MALAVFLAVALFAVLRPSIHGHDGVLNYSYLHSLMFDGNLDFANEYKYYLDREAEWFNNEELRRDPTTGLASNQYGVGCSILWSPWVLAFHAAGRAANALFGTHLVLDGYSRLYEVAVGIGSCFYASLGLILVFRLLRRQFDESAAFWSCLLVWLASPLFFYMYFHPSMSHANSFFLAALFLAIYLGGDGLLRWAVLGLTGAMLFMTRFQDAALLAAMVPGEIWRMKRTIDHSPQPTWSSRFSRYALFAAAFAIGITPQLVAWHILQGNAFSGPRAYGPDGSMRLWAPVHVLEVLFSSRHGLFFWHPALLIAAAGLLIADKNPRLKLIALAAFSAELWIISSWSVWWAGASFGQRMFISALPFMAIGAASLFAREGKTRRPLQAATIALILWNFGCVVQYGAGMIDRQKPVPMTTLLRNNFLEVPRRLMGKQ